MRCKNTSEGHTRGPLSVLPCALVGLAPISAGAAWPSSVALEFPATTEMGKKCERQWF